MLAADGLLASGGQLAQLSNETMEALDKLLPPHWGHNNPIDVLGDALPERFAKVMDIAVKDPNIDGMLVILVRRACRTRLARPSI